MRDEGELALDLDEAAVLGGVGVGGTVLFLCDAREDDSPRPPLWVPFMFSLYVYLRCIV